MISHRSWHAAENNLASVDLSPDVNAFRGQVPALTTITVLRHFYVFDTVPTVKPGQRKQKLTFSTSFLILYIFQTDLNIYMCFRFLRR